jgi:hypothetical protein
MNKKSDKVDWVVNIMPARPMRGTWVVVAVAAAAVVVVVATAAAIVV